MKPIEETVNCRAQIELSEASQAFSEVLRAESASLSSEENVLDPELAKRITKEDLLGIYQYLLMHSEVLFTFNINDGGRRFKKEDTLCARTFSIAYVQKAYNLFIETKRKLSDGSKDCAIIKKVGSVKTGIEAWRVLPSAQEVYSLTCKPQEQLKQQEDPERELRAFCSGIRHEVLISQRLSSQSNYIARNDLGGFFEKKGEQRIQIYSKKAKGDLRLLWKIPAFSLDTVSIQNKYIEQLLFAVKAIHDNDMVHQDLGEGNLLIDEQDNLLVTDFGSCMRQGTRTFPIARKGYQSPEIAYVFNQKVLQLKEAISVEELYNFYNEDSDFGIGALGNFFLQKYHTKFEKQNKALYLSVAKETDMWAVGCLIYQLRHQGRRPCVYGEQAEEKSIEVLEEIKRDPLLRSLLCLQVERASIEEAIEVFQASKQEKKTGFSPSFS